MKNYVGKALILVSMLGAASTAQAWVYSFTNHTNRDLAIGMRHMTLGYKEYIVVPAHSGNEFFPGRKGVYGVNSDIGNNKVGYIASQFFYVYLTDKNGNRIVNDKGSPIEVNEDTRAKLQWKALPIEWVESPEHKLALEVAEAVGDMTEKVGIVIAKAGAAYATGGATVAADAAAEVAKQAAKKAATGKALNEFAASGYNLGKFIATIHKNVSRNLIGNYHFDLIEDEKGNLICISII